MLKDRANAICILEVLKEHSDADHILPMKELVAIVECVYGIKPDRRTVYAAVSLLQELGYDISVYEDNGIGYYLRGRDFEPSEINILTDAVYAFPFVTAKQSQELINKLQKLLSKNYRKTHSHLTVIKTEKKTDNRQVLWNVELLDDAISKKCKVRFTYLQRDINKKQIPRRDKPYVVSPYRLVFTNEHYYLVCDDEHHDGVSYYRIDRMKDLVLLEDQGIGEIHDVTEIDKAVYAFTGTPERISLRCHKSFLDDVMDKFGSDIRVKEETNEQITISFRAISSGVRFWALQYLPYIEILEPQMLRDAIIKDVQNNPYTK